MPDPVKMEVDVKGMNRFLWGIRKLAEPKKQQRLLMQALNAGASPLKNKMRAGIRGAPAIRFGWLLKSITSKVKGYPSGNVILIVGARDKYVGEGENPAYYMHLVDLGVKAHAQRSPAVNIGGQWRRINPDKRQGAATQVTFGGGQSQIAAGGASRVYWHPGAQSKPFRAPAYRAVSSEQINGKILKKADQILAKLING